MPSAKNCRKPKMVDSSIAARRNLKSEINWAEKKMKKLLARHEAGTKRWTLDKGPKGRVERKELNQTQGIMPDSKRHKGLIAHIDRMKSRLKELGG